MGCWKRDLDRRGRR